MSPWTLLLCGLAAVVLSAHPAHATPPPEDARVHYRTVTVGEVDIFYREAGPPDAPVILLLHGFPTSSHMYRDLIPLLAGRYRVIAPDYPGYGYSSAPQSAGFEYSFDNLAKVMTRFVDALGLSQYTLYMQDFGGPVGFRMAADRPDRIQGLIVQNANAYDEGLSAAMDGARAAWERRTPETEAAFRALLSPEMTRWQYLEGAREIERISPDAWSHAQSVLDRAGSEDIQLALLHDYGSNVRAYPEWQDYLRRSQPPLLVVWGRNDPFFKADGALAYARDVPNAEIHLLDAGHFALEEMSGPIASLVLAFMGRNNGAERAPGE